MDAALRDLETPQPGADIAALTELFNEARTVHTEAVAAYERAQAVQEARAAIPAEAAPVARTPEDDGTLEVRDGADVGSGREPLVYAERNAEGRASSASVFSDLYRAQFGQDSAARERLNRHMQQMADPANLASLPEEKRAAITQTLGEGGELIAPVYLQEEWIGVPRASRPFADSLTQKPWVQTNTINYPKVKTGTTVAVQTDTGSVSSTAITTELVTGVSQTVAGQQDVAQSLVDLSMPGVDTVIFDDLGRAYDTQLDVKLIEGTVTNAKGINQLAGTNSITFTEATPKVGKFYSKLASAIAEVSTKIFAPPTVIAMTPLRWAWMLAALDTQERPLIVPVGQPGYNAMGLDTRVAAEAIVGNMFGLPVLIDASIPQTLGAGTNQDEVYVYRAEHLHLRESVPTLRIFPEVLSGKLEVRFQLYGYYNAILGRLPKAISKISGTGLAAPTF